MFSVVILAALISVVTWETSADCNHATIQYAGQPIIIALGECAAIPGSSVSLRAQCTGTTDADGRIEVCVVFCAFFLFFCF